MKYGSYKLCNLFPIIKYIHLKSKGHSRNKGINQVDSSKIVVRMAEIFGGIFGDKEWVVKFGITHFSLFFIFYKDKVKVKNHFFREMYF